MNRREFSKTALGVAAAAVIAPAARAAVVAPVAREAATRSILDCIVIDYEKNKRVWRYLGEPDEKGRTFVFEDGDEAVTYRHFEFLGSDGLVVGESSTFDWWTAVYDAFESEFLLFYKPPVGRRFSRDEFRDYAEGIRADFNGRIVPIEELASTANES